MAKKLNLPATLVREVNGKKYRLNGTLLAINESAGTCTMQFGARISSKVPTDEVYLNEGLMDTIKEVGGKVWKTIKRVIRSIGGFLIPVDEKGNQLFQFINAPVNVASMKLPKSIDTVVTAEVAEYAEDHAVKLGKNVKTSIADCLAEAEARDSEEINKYWGRVMKEYAKPENESLNLGDTIKMVNEKYYHRVGPKQNNTLNEAAIPSLHNLVGGYGAEVGSKELTGLIYDSIWGQLNPLSGLDANKRMDEADTAKPLLIWGAPGIGKTAIISKAAELLEEDGYKLNMHTIKCAALKRDDFELPDTVENVVGQKLAISNPKTWLPVYDPKGLTKMQLTITDAVYNSGVYKMTKINDKLSDTGFWEDASAPVDVEREEKQLWEDSKDTTSVINTNSIYQQIQDVQMNPQIKELLDKSEYNGGIIFFDEFARLQPNVTNIMMGLMGERMYGEDFILASQWTTIAAANRLSDDLKGEKEEEFRAIWDNAKQGRYQHYTYVPTKEDWLEWARRVNKHTGLQNVDEKFCKFIEVSPAYVWYNALDLNAQDDIPDNVKTALGELGTLDKNGQMTRGQVGILSSSALDAIEGYLQDPASRDQLSINTWNGRTWDEVVNTNMIQALRKLVGPTKEDLMSVMSPVTHTTKEYGRTKSYQAMSLDDDKLAIALNKLSDRKWALWAEPKCQRTDPRQELIWNDRIGFWNAWIDNCLIPDAVGGFNKPAKQWKEYNSTKSFLTPDVISDIWKQGYSGNESLVKFNRLTKYEQLPTEKWKAADPVTVKKVIKEVLDAYPGDYHTDVATDYEFMQNFHLGTKADYNRLKPLFDVKLIDGDRSKIEGGQVVEPAYKRAVNILFNESTIKEEDTLAICAILDNCPTASKLVNIMKWLSILTLEVGNEEYLAAATAELTRKYLKEALSVPGYNQLIVDNQETIRPPFAVYEYVRGAIQNSLASGK